MALPQLNQRELQKLRAMKTEATSSLLREDAEKDLRREIANRAKDELNIDKKLFNKLVRLDYKDQVEEASNEVQEIEDILQRLNDPNILQENDEEDNGE